MNGLRTLSVVLAVQVVLATWMWWPTDRSALASRPLLDVEPAAITEIAIARHPAEGDEPDWLELRREGGGWVIASADGYPADPARVEELIDRLLGLRVRTPVATTRPSHNALKVGEREYGRRVRIRTGDTGQELVVGAARSDSVHVRRADETDVYLAEGVSEYALSDSPSAYWSRDYVSVPVEEIRTVLIENEHGRVALARTDQGWTVEDAPEGTVADEAAIASFLDEVTGLRLVEPVGTVTTPEYGLADGARIQWTLEADDQSVAGGYVVGAVDDTNAYVKSDTARFVVRVAAADVEPLRAATRDRFLAPAAPAPEAPDDAPGGERP